MLCGTVVPAIPELATVGRVVEEGPVDGAVPVKEVSLSSSESSGLAS